MLLQILRALECFATEITLVRLQGYVNANVRSDVVTLDGGGATCAPLAGQVEVVGALATDVAFADVILGGMLASGVATRKNLFATRNEKSVDARHVQQLRRQTFRHQEQLT